ncbi:MAG: DUF4367 domain-containing protein [Clostridia bacterium]|nr:DUF4367 domain-containing protein [Clostridia bacterium]
MSKQISFDRLDTLLALASAEYMKQVTSEFLAAETDATLSPEAEEAITGMIRVAKRKVAWGKAWKVIRTILVAALAAATVALAACMAYPEIREAIWKVVLTWGDESVKVDFVPATTHQNSASKPSSSNHSTPKPVEPIPEPPKRIEELRMPGYMPVGWECENTKQRKMFEVSYYDSEAKMVATFTQTVLDVNTESDSDHAIVDEITINGWEGVLFTYEDQPNVYAIYWQDYEYRYGFYGLFESYDQFIRMAESVYVDADDSSVRPPESLERVKIPNYYPSAFSTAKGTVNDAFFQLSFYDADGNFKGTYTQMTIGMNSHADAEGATVTDIVINGFAGVLFAYADEPGVYSVYWQDSEYRYHIYALFDSREDAIRMAESVSVR